MANAWCINAYDCNGCLIQTLQNLDSACIGVGVQYTAPNPLDDKRLDYIKYTDKCWCVQCLSTENEILIYATNGVIKNLTLTNDDVNEAIKIKWNDIFWSNRAKTIVRYKTGSAPVSITDGTLAVEETTKNQYSSTPFSLSGVLDETTYYITAFAVDSNNTVISSQTASVTTDFWWHPSANTLFYIKNDWEIADHSQYAHVMSWYWTSKFYTLSNWRKVAHFDWNNWIHSNQFTQANNKTTFTLHWWWQYLWYNTNNGNVFWWVWRSKSSSSTSDRWWLWLQTLEWDDSKNTLIYWVSDSVWWTVPTSSHVDVPSWTFKLFSITVNWNSFKIYINWTLTKSFTWNTIRWWSSTWPVFWLWKLFYSDWTLWNWWPLCYIWETVLEDKTETDAEVLNFYNKTKNHYS